MEIAITIWAFLILMGIRFVIKEFHRDNATAKKCRKFLKDHPNEKEDC